jgi:hypothetical protein
MMSTIDPAAARRERRARRAGDRRVLAGALCGATVMTACAVLLGLAVGETADLLRDSAINSSFDEREPYPVFWGIGTIGLLWTLGAFGTMLGSLAATALLDAYHGGEPQPRILPPVAVGAVAIAVAANAPTWLDPLAVGIRLDPVFHEDEPWGPFAWIAYWADLWVPALALAIAGLVVAYAERHRRRLRRLLADRDRLLADGRRTRGVITDAAFRTAVNDQGQRSVVGVEVTVKYSDDHGVERWVSRFSHDRTAMPATGFADVLFDPVRPGVDRLVFVAFHRDPDPADWIGPAI